MPELDGLGVAASLGDSPDGARPNLVFLTGYGEHAVKAFELHAVDYLLKPVSKPRLSAMLDKIGITRSARSRQLEITTLLEQLAAGQKNRKIAIRCGTKDLVFDPTRISAILAQDHYTEMRVEDPPCPWGTAPLRTVTPVSDRLDSSTDPVERSTLCKLIEYPDDLNSIPSQCSH